MTASLTRVSVAFRIRTLTHESERVALVGPVKRNTLQQPLDRKRVGLPAFGNGLDNLGRNIGESQEPTDLRVTQAEAASNLYRVGYIALVAMRASKTVLARAQE
jgi:hypothetical protein